MAPYASQTWWDANTVALVTGANKGIGFETARILGEQGLTVVATSRTANLGEAAVKELQSKVPSATFVYSQCDITDPQSVADCAAFVKAKFGRLTILINNAGIAFKGNTFGTDEAATTIACNLKGTRRMTEAMLPLMGSGARVVNVCSMAGKLKQLSSEELKKGFMNPSDADAVEALADSFVQAIRDGDHKEKGFGSSMYGISKLSEISYTLWLARQLQDKGIMVNAVCPGWCQTDMSSKGGSKTAGEGADTPVWVALRSPDNFVTGKFFQERQEIEW